MNDSTNRPLHGHTPHNVMWLIIGICAVSGLGFLINAYDPDSWLYIGAFFLLLFLAASAISFFVTNIVRRSLLLGSGVLGIFFLRFLGLRELYYLVLLLLCLISIELYFQKK